MILIRPAIPAALSRWPMLVFTDPSTKGRSRDRPLQRTDCSASISMGSPRRVPVPWASMYSIRPGARRASASAGADHGLLGGAVGGRQTVAAAVMVHGRAAEEGENPITAGQRIAQPLEHHQAAALAAYVPVGRCVEGLARARPGPSCTPWSA